MAKTRRRRDKKGRFVKAKRKQRKTRRSRSKPSKEPAWKKAQNIRKLGAFVWNP